LNGVLNDTAQSGEFDIWEWLADPNSKAFAATDLPTTATPACVDKKAEPSEITPTSLSRGNSKRASPIAGHLAGLGAPMRWSLL